MRWSSYWVWRACVASLCSMHVHRLRLPLPRLGRLSLLLGQKACLASSATTRRALCSRHLQAARSRPRTFAVSCTACLAHATAAASACIAAASAAAISLGRLRCSPVRHVGCCSTIQSADATRCPCGSAAALHSRHTTRARPRLASLGLVLPLGLRAWCSVALAARLACKVCGVGCSARSAGRRSTRHRRSTRTSGAGTRRV